MLSFNARFKIAPNLGFLKRNGERLSATLDRVFGSSLNTRLVTLFLVLALVPMAITGGLAYWLSQDALRSRISDQLNTIAQDDADAINTWLGERKGDLKQLAADETIRSLDATAAGATIRRYMAQGGAWSSIAVAAQDGTVVYDDSGAASASVSDRDWFKSAMQGEWTFSQGAASSNGTSTIVVAGPVMTSTLTIGVLSGIIPTNVFETMLRNGKIGTTGEAYLVDSQGVFLTPSRFAEQLKLAGRTKTRAEGELKVDTYGARQALSRRFGVGQYVNYRGVTAIGAYQPINANGWALLVEQESSEAFASVDSLARVIFLVALVSAIAVLGAAILFARSITRPVGQTVRMIQEMGRGHLRLRLDMKRRDEIGIMARAMDTFAGDLLHDVVGTMAKIAAGDLSTELAPSDDKDEIVPALAGTQNALRRMIDETTLLTKAATEGRLATRADVTKFQGEYRQIVQGVNDTLDAVIGPLNVTAEYVDRIAKGDTPAAIAEQYQGDFDELKHNLNELIASTNEMAQAAQRIAAGDLDVQIHVRSDKDVLGAGMELVVETLRRLVGETNQLTSAAAEGNLAVRGPADRFQGGYREIVQGVNSTLDAVIGPLNAAADYVDRISKGEIPPPIAEDYRGDFNALKDSLNGMIAYLGEMARAATEIAGGNLQVQVRPVSEHDTLGCAFVEMIRHLQAVVGDIVLTSEKLAAGDLTVQPAGSYSGEFVKIKNALETALDGLNRTMRQTNLVVHQVAQSVAQVQSVSQDLAAGAQEQSAAVEEVTSNLEHTDGQVKSSAVSATLANQLVGQAATLAGAGQQKMKALTGAMAAIATSSQEIGKIIKVIDDIAFQTNLLALNAAVEAARAGQAGRGFAVVAQEVRNLAERSAKAAKSTAELIEGSTKQVQEGVKITDATKVALGEIVENVVKVKDLVGEIAAASEEEAKSLAQISKAMGQVNSGAQSASAQSEQLASSAEGVSGLAGKLREEVTRFQLRQAGSGDGAVPPAEAWNALAQELPDGITPDILRALEEMIAEHARSSAVGPAGGAAEQPAVESVAGNGHELGSLDRDARGYDEF